MYEAFFGLHAEPFSIAPDPRFLYMSDKHREALALLNVGLQRGSSFVLLTGEIGAGKTTVWRRFLEQLPSNVDVASVVNPKLDVRSLFDWQHAAQQGDAARSSDAAVENAPRPRTTADGTVMVPAASGRSRLVGCSRSRSRSARSLKTYTAEAASEKPAAARQAASTQFGLFHAWPKITPTKTKPDLIH